MYPNASRPIATIILFVISVFCSAGTARAESVTRKISIDASEALERGMEIDGVKPAEAGGGVTLYDSTLIEDDGPGIGPYADFLPENGRSPVVKIEGPNRLKKILHIDRPGAKEVRLYTTPGVGVKINGTEVAVGKDKYPLIPAGLLKEGDNEIILSCPEKSPHEMRIARRADILRNAPDRKDRPPRSFTSRDGGKTWNAVDGEALVRLFLLQYPSTGSFASPVIDLGRDDTEPLALAPISIRSLAITREADAPASTGISFLVRAGATPVYEKAKWTDWQALAAPIAPHLRFVQWKAVLTTADAKITPTLRNVTLRAEIDREAPPAWAKDLSIKSSNDPEIRYTSIPFQYEDPANPHIANLRAKYHLDEVVSGSDSELEKLVKLRHWVHSQWKYHAPTDGWFPAWDADEILTHKDGFCVHFAITYMQCAISLGYQTRYVFGGHPGTLPSGHEVCEVWSNQFNKWILMDPEGDLHYIDPTLNNDVPLSMLELHDRILRTFYDGKIATSENHPTTPAHSPWIAMCRGLSLAPEAVYRAGDPGPKEWEPWIKWLNVRYMPRNNFFGQPLPVPIEQGFHWDWPDYYVWHDAATPREWSYRHFVSRRADLNWTINQAVFSARAGQENTLEIQLGTATPFFQTFLINIDGKGWKPADAQFNWALHAGENRLEMRVRNSSGIEGPVSSMEVIRRGD
jgi:transglutaminase-like putative cysteine protease